MAYRARGTWSVSTAIALAAFGLAGSCCFADSPQTQLQGYNVTSIGLGRSSADSVPIGNGDIGLNVWTEANGDLCFYIAKTDAWSEENTGPRGLLKLGKIRVRSEPNILAAGPVRQTLNLHDGRLEIVAGAPGQESKFQVWVDANHPVIRLASTTASPASLQVTYEPLRNGQVEQVSPDVLVESDPNRVVWYHHNANAADPALKGYTFGAMLGGRGFEKSGASAIRSAQPKTEQNVSIVALTAHPVTPEAWLKQIDNLAEQSEKGDPVKALAAHQKWWHDFWNRSWMFVHGDKAADVVTRGSILQRFMTACAGRGQAPIKFNGSLFTVEHEAFVDFGVDEKTGKAPVLKTDADYRRWGGQYWFQNTRAMYWPRLMSGDFDMMLPLFRMYQAQMKQNADLVKKYYNHDGAYFAETGPFYGGLKKITPQTNEWTDHYFTPVLELSAMMLDYYEFTQDEAFARETLLPIARAGLTFYEQHFKRDANGKLLLDPCNALETYWVVSNPAPDIAGLQYVAQRLQALPASLTTPEDRSNWKRLQDIIPLLPQGEKRDKTALLPYTGPQTAKIRNSENCELYAVYPFRLYGVTKPNLQLARDTFDVRTFTEVGCWAQDTIFAAYLGLTDVAKKQVTETFSKASPYTTFPAFWEPGHDFDPDQDNGGNGENALQKMLMQCEGKKILLLPAWPAEWEVDFKLKAPYQTTLTGRVREGKIIDLVVEPESRRQDIVFGPFN